MMQKNGRIPYSFTALLVAWLLLANACNKKQQIDNPLFEVRTNKETGLNFTNQLKPTTEFNLFSYMYYYNGAGVGAADFNKDGLVDLFFAANQGGNKLFLNKGALQFTDVSAAANIPVDGSWSTGVSVIDINSDGLLDIYICRVGNYKVLKGKNQLLVCKEINRDGVPVFSDEAAAYGLDFSGFSTQAAFVDYDGDDDLDLFLLNHSVNHDGNYAPRKNFLNTYDSLAGQRLYRNDVITTADQKQQAYFTNVTATTGINGTKIGYGLGVVVSDVNVDGWPDIYVGNDFHENDYLYINQKNGTFSEETTKRLMHTSQFSMGVDAADITNDGFPEIISMDMLPYDPYMIRRSLAEDDYNIFQNKINYGYNYQYARNNLQWNRGNGLFSEVGQYAAVNATDWSWAALWMDFDNNGRKDLFVSNGIPKRMNDIDYINFVSNEELQGKMRSGTVEDKDMALVNKFPEIKIPNRFFRNKGQLQFDDVTDSIKNNLATFSNGSVYADLDNDGDLDLITNNINDPVLLYENKTTKQNTSASIVLKGSAQNLNAIGSTVVLFAGNEIRTYEHNPVHGFLSSMLVPLHIGLDATTIDSVFLIWPDRTYQSIHIKSGKQEFAYAKELPLFDYNKIINFHRSTTNALEDITAATKLQQRHVENVFNEFAREPLLPHMNSTEGPALAVADINHDGLEDVFIGSSKGYRNVVYMQTAAGTFSYKPQPAMWLDSMTENVDAVFQDVNNDTHVDLLIAAGGNEYYGADSHLLPLLYMNDGNGNFSKNADAFNNIVVTQSKIAVHDFTGDGFADIFLAGRTEPWNFGVKPRSYLLKNEGTGKFTDVTTAYTKELLQPGLVTDAQWVDINADGKKDLLLCYEWGGIEAFISASNTFTRQTITANKGWWNFVLPFDADGNGQIDFVAGNFGLNTRLKASAVEPLSLYVNDFDANGRNEQVLTYYLQHKEIPFATKQELEKQLPLLKKKFLYAEDFAKASLNDLFGADKLKKAQKHSVDYLSNAVLLNKGKSTFEIIALPYEAQLTTYRTATIVQANNDSLPDVLLLGNYYDNNVEVGRQDADFGTLLINKGAGRFLYSPLNGIAIHGQVRSIKSINIKGKQAYILAKNNDALQVIRFK
ncbi:MAG TPA: VCBS repeat-containing protein [Lacibacter sp.]|nr:VCBS repeat-containing protein [Lacibacter sp.]